MSDKAFFITPVVGMVHNVVADTYHPILYQESPLPGPIDDSKPMRHKSKMHRTAGFATRAEAVASIETELIPQIAGTVYKCLDPKYDVPWDGTDVPADVAFFKIDKENGTAIRIM